MLQAFAASIFVISIAIALDVSLAIAVYMVLFALFMLVWAAFSEELA